MNKQTNDEIKEKTKKNFFSLIVSSLFTVILPFKYRVMTKGKVVKILPQKPTEVRFTVNISFFWCIRLNMA